MTLRQPLLLYTKFKVSIGKLWRKFGIIKIYISYKKVIKTVINKMNINLGRLKVPLYNYGRAKYFL